MRLGCLFPLVSLALVIGGGQGLYTALSNSKPVEIPISDLVKKSPEGKWLRVTGGELDTLNAVYTSTFGKGDAKEIYLPVMPPGEDSSVGTIHLLLLTKDPELVEFVNATKEFDEKPVSEMEMIDFIAKNKDRLRPARDIEGLVQFGIESNSKRERKIRKLFANLAPDALILEDGKKPSSGQGAGMMLAGLVLGGFLIRRAAKQTPASPPSAAPPPMPGEAPRP